VVETSSGKAFVRRGDPTVELKYGERPQLEYQKGQASFEDEIGCQFDQSQLMEDILNEPAASITSKDKLAVKHAPEEILRNCHLLKEHNGKPWLTKAGVFLLSKHPTEHIPGAYVRFMKYQGKEKKTGSAHNAVKDETFAGPLPRVIQRVIAYISTQVREFSYLGRDGEFVSEPEYPLFAWTEAIINALVHRSYSERNRPIFVELYDNRIEVTSPGDYLTGVSPLTSC